MCSNGQVDFNGLGSGVELNPSIWGDLKTAANIDKEDLDR